MTDNPRDTLIGLMDGDSVYHEGTTSPWKPYGFSAFFLSLKKSIPSGIGIT
jgi:hypothetical protein